MAQEGKAGKVVERSEAVVREEAAEDDSLQQPERAGSAVAGHAAERRVVEGRLDGRCR